MVLSPSSFSSRLCVGSLVGLVSVRKELRFWRSSARSWSPEAVSGVGSGGGVGFLGFCNRPPFAVCRVCSEWWRVGGLGFRSGLQSCGCSCPVCNSSGGGLWVFVSSWRREASKPFSPRLGSFGGLI